MYKTLQERATKAVSNLRYKGRLVHPQGSPPKQGADARASSGGRPVATQGHQTAKGTGVGRCRSRLTLANADVSLNAK